MTGCVDRNLIGRDFYDRNKERLRSLRMNCLIYGDRVVNFERACILTGLELTQNVYMYLHTAASFAVKKYRGKEGSNGTSLTLLSHIQRVKKGSGKFRKLIERGSQGEKSIENLRIVKSFFEISGCTKPAGSQIKALHTLWSINGLPNRVWCFAFQFYNNSLPVGARVAARYRNTGQLIDQRCAFCMSGRSANPSREDFKHIFLECQILKPIVNRYFLDHFDMPFNEGRD